MAKVKEIKRAVGVGTTWNHWQLTDPVELSPTHCKLVPTSGNGLPKQCELS